MSLKQLTRKEMTILDVLDRILDKGMVINGDITLSIAGVDLLTLKISLVIASLETAKRYGIPLPWEKRQQEYKKQPEPKNITNVKSVT